MELVVDANVIISAMIASAGKTCELLFSDKLRLFAPELLLEELKRYKGEISQKSGLSEIEVDTLSTLIYSIIDFIPFSEFEDFISEASKICPDPKDIEYFALALKLKYPIWSNDKKIKQEFLKVLSTSELLKMF